MPEFHPVLSTSDVQVDAAQAFLLWCSNNFDCAATAHALGIPAINLQRCIDDENWVARVAPIVEKIKSQKPGDFEKSVNRSIAFVQGHRLRSVCERVVKEMTNWSTEELRENLMPENINKSGVSKKISTRFLGDIASAIEKANALCFAALGDTASERCKRSDSVDSGPVLDIHAKISACMGSVSASKTPRKLLLDSQLEVAADIAQKAAILKPIADDTYVNED